LEPSLATQAPHFDDLLQVASQHAQDARARCTDVAAMLFPTGRCSPTEEMLSVVSTTLRNLVFGIEQVITQISDDDIPKSWQILSMSGALKEPALVDFAVAHFSSERLKSRLASSSEIGILEQLPAQLISGGEPIVADAAQTILSTSSMLRRSPNLIYRQLPAELLHQTAWRIVAALQISSGQKNELHVANCQQLLTNYDEGSAVRSAALKIVHFINGSSKAETYSPDQSGIEIFTAALSARTNLDYDHVLCLIDGYSSAPLAIMLRYCGLSRDAAMNVVCLFKGFDLTPFEISSIDRFYDSLTPIEMEDAFSSWRDERIRFLTFPATDKSAG
jgi:hypothetical protein